MAIQLLESPLGDLLQEEILLSVVVNRLRALRVMISTEVSPKSPYLCESSPGYSVDEMMLMESRVWQLSVVTASVRFQPA